MRRVERLRGKKSFALFARAGQYRGSLLRVAVVQIEEGRKAAFVVPKKICPRAVDRNKLKRRLRELYKLCRNLLPSDIQIMIIALPDASSAKFEALYADIEKLFKKIASKDAGNIRH